MTSIGQHNWEMSGYAGQSPRMTAQTFVNRSNNPWRFAVLLRVTPTSPFGRKVRMAISHLGLSDRIEQVKADPMDPADALRRDNPLGKIPTLVTDDGKPVFDSRVILEYLDHVAGGGRIIPTAWPARIEALTLQAMCD